MKTHGVVLLVLLAASAGNAAAAPGLITYQGRITDSGGSPVTTDITVTFTFWNAVSGGTQLGSGFSDADTVTPDADGVYATLIGDDPSPAVPAAVFNGNNVWLNVNVNGEDLAPRKRVSSVAYALKAGDADTLDGAHSTDLAGATHTHDALDIASGTLAPFLIPGNITLTGSAFIYGEAIRAGTIAQSYIDVAIARDSEILPAVLAGDGAGSGLDADTLDGQHAAAFAASDHIHSGYAASTHSHAASDITSGELADARMPATIARDSEVMPAVLASDGTGSGLDADKLDGKDSSDFVQKSGMVVEITGLLDVTSITQAIDAESSAANVNVITGANTSALAGTGSGGLFMSYNTQGRGVYGYAQASGAVMNYGGYFEANGNSGVGVYGAGNASGTAANIGGKFVAYGSAGRGVQGDGTAYDFYASGPGADYGPFTGAHEVRLAADYPAAITPGLVVCTTGPSLTRVDKNGEVSLSSTLPTVRLADTAQDKAVIGVLVKETPLAEDHWYKPEAGERFGVVNALGDGRVWACTANGDIEMGDYLTTSAVPGYAQRQNDDLQHNYTVGKVTESVDWSAVTDTVEFGGQTYKACLIAVVYTCG